MENPFVNMWVFTVTLLLGVICWLLMGSCTVTRQPLPSQPVIQYIYTPDGKQYRIQTDDRHTLNMPNSTSVIMDRESDRAVFPQYYQQQQQWQRGR